MVTRSFTGSVVQNVSLQYLDKDKMRKMRYCEIRMGQVTKKKKVTPPRR